MPRLLLTAPASSEVPDLAEATAGVIKSGPRLTLRLRDPTEPSDRQKQAGNYAKRKVPWQGLMISVENEAGDMRRGVGADGDWATRLFYAYGYVNGTMGVDGDQVDVYLGPELEHAPMVYVVHQRRYGAWEEYDEDKCMLGFLSEEDAVHAYLSCYDDERFLGPVTAMPVAEFVEKVKATKDGAMMIKSIVAPHLRDGRMIRAYDNHRQRKAKPQKIDLFAGGGDPVHDQLEALKARTVRYASGLSMVKDFTPAAHAGHGVGVEIGELSEYGMERLARALVDWKTPIFIDSGMFGRFMSSVRSGAPQTTMDFSAEVFPKYDRFLDLVGQMNEAEESLPPPLLVMPDVVGDQIASLNLIAHHRNYVRSTIDFSGVAKAIIPIQRGPLAMADAYHELVRILGTDDFIVGVPSNAAATTPEEFVTFLRDAKPRGVHILGALADSRLTPRLAQIVESGHTPEHVSADANPLRSIIIERGQSPEQRAAKLRDRLGERARQEHLDQWIAHHGGLEAVRAAYLGASVESQARIMGLFMDLTGLEPDAVARRYELR